MFEDKQTILGKLMFFSTNQTHTDVARYVYEKYKHEYKCSSIAYNRWYYYKNHRWVQNDRGYELKKKMSSEVSQDYAEYSKYCENKSEEFHEDDPEKDIWQIRSKKSFELVYKLKNQSYNSSVFTQCQELFYDEEFEDILDSNNNLLHFNNGVYDLDKKEFRQGYKEDNISLSTGINYIEQSTEEDNEKIKQVEYFLNKVLPIENVRNYVLNLLASFLHGMNKEQKFHIWIGSGSNGKSTLIDLYKKTIGGYYVSMSLVPIIPKYRSLHGYKNVDTILLGKRFLSNDEPHMGIEIEIEISFTSRLVLTCNELPNIPYDDDGTWRRIRVVEFVSKFCENPNPSKPYEFLIDHELPNKFEEWKEVFMYMLIQIYQNSYRVNGIKEPDEILKNTHEYRKDNNIYANFIDSTLIEEPTSSFGIDDIFPKFKTFLQSNSFYNRKYTRRELEKHLNKIIGKCNMKKKWKGWKLINPNDDDSDEEEKNTTNHTINKMENNETEEKKTEEKKTEEKKTEEKKTEEKKTEEKKTEDTINLEQSKMLPPPPPPKNKYNFRLASNIIA